MSRIDLKGQPPTRAIPAVPTTFCPVILQKAFMERCLEYDKITFVTCIPHFGVSDAEN